MSRSKNWFFGGDGILGDPREGGTPKLCQNICLLHNYWYKTNWHPRLTCSQNWFEGFSKEEVLIPQNYAKIFIWSSADTKKKRML